MRVRAHSLAASLFPAIVKSTAPPRRAAAAVLSAVALVAALAAGPARAQVPDVEALKRCAQIEDPELRLACYDAAVQGPGGGPERSPLLEPVRNATTPDTRVSLIEDRWSIGVSGRDDRFDLRPHKPSYFLLGRYSDSPNRLPQTPSQPPPAESELPLKHVEAKFQVSFKLKLADLEDVFGASLWAAYTQQAHWQLYNSSISRPFRETNYEPEVMLAFHPDRNVLGWRWRLFAIGFNHQSNGRADPLSRSWNRLTATFGFDQGNFGLLVRPWIRVRGDGEDDNPDIMKFMGYGDVVGVYKYRRHTLSLLGRYNTNSAKGALQFAWSFPLHRRLRGYLEAFTGYGESLIDYNVRQSTIGIGISLADWL